MRGPSSKVGRRTTAVMVSAVMASVALAQPADAIAGFGDVDVGHFFTEPVQWMVDNQITTGTSPTCFSPYDPVTRGQAAAFMWRMEGFPSGTPPHPFVDVVKDWQQAAVSWMAHTGITTGTTPSTYSPDDVVTRGQLATFFYRYQGSPEVSIDYTHPVDPPCADQVPPPAAPPDPPDPDPPDPDPPSPVPCGLSDSGLPFTEGETDLDLNLPGTGQLDAVMIFVDFSDAPASESTVDLYDDLVPYAGDWFTEVSYGQLTLDVTPIHTWYRMSSPSSGYGFDDGSLTFFEHRDFIEEAMLLADATVDFSELDAVYVTPSAGTVLTFGAAFDAYAGMGIAVDGIEMRNAVTFGEWMRTPRPNYAALTLVHETGHLLGLPDLYDLADTSWPTLHRFVGAWDPMGELWPGGHFVAWHKEKLGWITESQIRCLHDPGVTDVTLTRLSTGGGVKAVVVPTGPATALVAELRTPDGLDANLCDEGVLVYRVDTSVLSGGGPISVVSPNTGADPATVLDCSLRYDAPLDLGPGESPTYTDPTGVSFRVLTAGASTYTVRVTVP